MSDSAGKAVFLSYASQDAEAARRICDSLRSGGVEVWFDADGGLEHGDEWDQKIRRQIKECVLFIPVISANTQARHEGYFRLEWELAAQRAMSIASGVPFILPVVIDDTREPDALVPDRFRMVQWTRLRGGEVPPDVLQRFLKLWSHRTGVLKHEAQEVARAFQSVSADDTDSKARATPKVGRRVPAVAWAMAAVVAVALVIFIAWPKRKDALADTGAGTRPPSVQESAPPLTPAQKLVAQARQVYENGDELNRENLSLADDLVQQALKLDQAEPTAWELAARLSYVMVWQQIDDSDDRRQALQRQAVRAVALAPNSVDAQVVALNSRLTGTSWVASGNDQQQGLRDVERELTALAAREPKNWHVQRALGMACRFLNRPDDSISALRRAVELSGGDPSATADLVNVLERRKQLNEAEAIAATGLARKSTARLLAEDVFLKTRWRGDLAGAEGAIASWPGWLLQDDRGLFMAWQTFFWKREPDKAIGFANRFPRDYLHDAWFAGPRAVLTAKAHETAGHAEAAQADWRSVVQVVARELERRPEDPSALYWKAWAFARLGQTDEARAICRVLLQRGRGNRSVFLKGTNLAPLLITAGLTEDALADVQTQLTSFNDSNTLTRAVLELDPTFDSIRNDPRFRQFVESAPAPAIRAVTTAAVSMPMPDEKSVAVLAFANLSEDKSNEYFSDGISEELINVLGKVPRLKVPARTSSFYFKSRSMSVPEIAKQLGVAYVIEGSVQRMGDKVKIGARLTKAADGFQVWTNSFTRDAKDVFAVEEEIAGIIATQLSLKLGVSSAASTAAVNPEAFELYMQARQEWNLRTAAGYDRAEELLKRGLALEPNFARAHAALADVWEVRGQETGRVGRFDQRHSSEAARIAAKARQALALDPDSAEAHASAGSTLSDAWNFPEAERELRRALDLNPNYASAHQWLGRLRERQGLMDEALAELKIAAELDPLSARIASNYATALYNSGQTTAAIATFDRALAARPDELQAIWWKSMALARLGRHEEAVALIRRHPFDDPRGLLFQIIVLAKAGLAKEAEALGPGLDANNQLQLKILCQLALGRRTEAMALLETGALVSNGLDGLFFDEDYDPLRSEPRFAQVLNEVGLTEAHARAQAWRKAHPPEKPEAKK